MAIGAKDHIDKLLVKKYSDKSVDNHDKLESTISAEDVMRIMNYVSTNTITQMKLSRRLSIATLLLHLVSISVFIFLLLEYQHIIILIIHTINSKLKIVL